MKNRLFAIGAMILMLTRCTQDELISSDKGKEPATAGSCLTLVGLSSPQTRVSIGDKTGDVNTRCSGAYYRFPDSVFRTHLAYPGSVYVWND